MQRGMYPENMVFGLDIGTRSIVGTVGYLDGEQFVVMAQRKKEHQTRSMLDGQIHDIKRVGATVSDVKTSLELELGIQLKEVCIAAAGRVLRTVTKHVDYEYAEEKIITAEDIYALESLGVEKSYEEFQGENETGLKFYCVGYSVVKYFMNGYPISNLEHHKAKSVSLDIIATFLPDDVVEGLYAAVKEAGLEVANLTLEPIAAIRLAIPEKYRMLNIALIDVGAGTSDISITRDGSIIAYGMIPCAGDSLTEVLAKHCLIDFVTAEKIKLAIETQDVVEYEDIMGKAQKIKRKEVLTILKEGIRNLAQLAADEIVRLNGGVSPAAVFVVGGGGKIAGYTDALASILKISKDRVALRGEEVMEEIAFCEGMKKDSLLVTPLGICLCYYEQSNNFMFVNFNGERIKLYDNRKLSIVDAVMQVQFPSEGLFPRRGKALTFFVNGKERIVRGDLGEGAEIKCNGQDVDINHPLHANDQISIKESTEGSPAVMQVGKLPEAHGELKIYVGHKQMIMPKFISVNGKLQPEFYEIQEGDRVELLDYYTVAQIATFMDVDMRIFPLVYVNNLPANLETEVYENFSVQWYKSTVEIPQEETENVGESYLESSLKREDTLDEDFDADDWLDEYGQNIDAEYEQDEYLQEIDEIQEEYEQEEIVQEAEEIDMEEVDSDEEDDLETEHVVENTFIPQLGEVALETIFETKVDSVHIPQQPEEVLAMDLFADVPIFSETGSVDSWKDAEVERIEETVPNKTQGQREEEFEEAAKNVSVNKKDLRKKKRIRNREKYEKTHPGRETASQSFEQQKSESNKQAMIGRDITIMVNNKPVTLRGKNDYMFVDIFDYINFDTSKMQGSGIATVVNGHDAQYTETLNNGDTVEVYWKQ